MKRGEIWWVNFDPSVGEGIRKKRLINKNGDISSRELDNINKAISIQLDL